MSKQSIAAGVLCAILLAVVMFRFPANPPVLAADDPQISNATKMINDGRQTFRFDTFGDESFWGDTLRLHQAIAGGAQGGVGDGLSPKMALVLGLKVDSDALPSDTIAQIKAGKVDLDNPATTVALMRANAVVGVTGFFDGGTLKSMGIQCAFCHSTVDNSVAPGIGHRLDGWANRDLNVGAIIALAPNLDPFASLLNVDTATVKKVLNSWGRGKFDAELILDGKAFRPDGKPAATLIPPAYGLAGVNLHTWTGWGSIPHWNAFVATLEMRGKGRFFDPRLNNAAQFPIAAAHGFGDLPHISPDDDRITKKLPALHFYQLSISAPTPKPGTDFDPAAAKRGDDLFSGKAKCNNCHVEPLWTEPGWNLHFAGDVCVDDFQSSRAPDLRYRTAPLAGLFAHQTGGFYHDGRFATLKAVVDHYNTCSGSGGPLNLTAAEENDLIQYLLSL
jgi:hypothetical protein